MREIIRLKMVKKYTYSEDLDVDAITMDLTRNCM
jgi:hypothetical protein